MRSLAWALIQCAWCPFKKRLGHTHTEGGPHEDMGRRHDHLHAMRRGLRRDQPCWHLEVRPLASRTAKRWVNFCYSSRPICGTSLRLPEQTNTQIHTETLSSQQGTERGFPGGPVVKNYLAMQETRVRSLVGEPRSQVWWSNYWACALCATVTIPHAASETRHGQINIKNLKKHWRLYWSILFMNTDDMSILWVTDVVILCKGFSKIWKSLELLLQGKKTEKGRACSLPLNFIRHHLAQTSLCSSNLLNDVFTQGLLWAPGWALHVWR